MMVISFVSPGMSNLTRSYPWENSATLGSLTCEKFFTLSPE